jgi:hypothetical protein
VHTTTIVTRKEGLEMGVEVHLHAHLGPRFLDRGGDVGVGRLGQGPRVRVDHMGLDAPVGQGGDHLQAQRRGLDDHRHLGLVDDLVPLHGPADVLHVVEAVEVASGHPGVGVVEPGGDHQAVPADITLSLHPDGVAGQVDDGHLRLVMDVDAGLDVRLFAGQEEPVEVGNLAAVHVRDATRAVGAVLVLGVDDHLASRVGRLGRTGGADACSPASDHHGTRDDSSSRHGPPPRVSAFTIGEKALTILSAVHPSREPERDLKG